MSIQMGFAPLLLGLNRSARSELASRLLCNVLGAVGVSDDEEREMLSGVPSASQSLPAFSLLQIA